MVSIIVVSYNTKTLLIRCLSSIVSGLPRLEFEIILVDNASTDGTVHEVQKLMPTFFASKPKLTIISNTKNEGFTKASNRGASVANGEYLLFLNSDVELIDASVERLISTAINKKAAIVGGNLQNAKDSTSNSFGRFYTVFTILLLLFGQESRLKKPPKTIQEVDWVSGGCMLVRKDVFKKLGGFDEKFFMYVEDMEFCFRAKHHGYKIFFDPSVNVTHIGQGSSNRSFAVIAIYEGILYFFKKHKTYWEYLFVRIALFVKALTAVTIGKATRNTYLLTTYSKALKACL